MVTLEGIVVPLKTTYVTGVKYTIGNRLTSKTTTFNDNIWRDISFEHINTAFWFNHTNLNIIENMRVEKCGRSLNSLLLKHIIYQIIG